MADIGAKLRSFNLVLPSDDVTLVNELGSSDPWGIGKLRHQVDTNAWMNIALPEPQALLTSDSGRRS